MRILDREAIVLDFGSLGFAEDIQKNFERELEVPHGIILVTGPTGSGKTTTLYTALSKLNTPERKIITVEDPVEYQLEGINQIQAQSSIGLDFSRALRSIVRQDSADGAQRAGKNEDGKSIRLYCTDVVT